MTKSPTEASKGSFDCQILLRAQRSCIVNLNETLRKKPSSIKCVARFPWWNTGAMGAASQHTMLVASSTLLLPTVFPASKRTVEDASSTCGHYRRWCPSCSQCGFHILLEDACWSAILAGKRRPMTILTFLIHFPSKPDAFFWLYSLLWSPNL